MSRFFDGNFATESIVFAPGNATFDQGPITMVALVKQTSVATAFVLAGLNAGTDVYGLLTDASRPYISRDFSAGGPLFTVDDWWWLAVTKAAGNVAPRWHLRNVTTGGAWTHANGTTAVTDGTGPVDTIVVGNLTAAGANDWRGLIAAVAVFGSALSDAQIEGACTLAAADLATAGPAWGTVFDQSSTATAAVDFTGGGGNQTAISGTSVSADDPPGWSYTVPPPSVNANRSPATVTAVAAIAAPTVQAGATLFRSTVEAVASIAAATVQAGATLFRSTVEAVASIASPTVTSTSGGSGAALGAASGFGASVTKVSAGGVIMSAGTTMAATGHLPGEVVDHPGSVQMNATSGFFARITRTVYAYPSRIRRSR